MDEPTELPCTCPENCGRVLLITAVDAEVLVQIYDDESGETLSIWTDLDALLTALDVSASVPPAAETA